MAEYIDKKQFDRKFIIKMLSPTTSTIFDVKDIIDELPTADVVEREKIDKAIEEMERYSTSFEYANRHDLASAVDYCIGVIQRNTGE